MFYRILSGIGVAVMVALGASTAAYAVDEYQPPPPNAATLAGSSVTTDCQRDVPWIRFDVVLNDPDSQVTSHDAVLVLSGGGESTEIALGMLVGGKLSGSVLWPGASVDGSGNATGWPGWAFENGRWVETSGNYAWTRGSISAVIRVNPELSVPLAYPPATAACAGPVASAGVGATSLPATGSAMPIAVAGVGAAMLAVGGAAIVIRRRRTVR